MTRPREMLDRLTIRRNICDAELRAFVPRRLRPARPGALASAFVLDPPASAADETTLELGADQLASVLDALDDPRAYDIRQRGGPYVLTFRRP